MRSSTILAALSSMASMASAHIAPWHESGLYEEKSGVKNQWEDTYDGSFTPVIPLGAQNSIKPPAGGFWFHGADLNVKKDKNNKKAKLRAGGTVTFELACNRKHTNVNLQGGVYTNGPNYGKEPEKDACPDGDEVWKSRHVSQNGKEVLLGCGLAITTKGPASVGWDLDKVKAEDLVVFSVKNDCVKKRDTTFAIPADMPECPPEGCICSWFWQGQESNDEMYMTGFLCEVEGGKKNGNFGTPQPAKYCGDGKTACVAGPKQPLIWANTDPGHPNNVQKSGDKKPGYIPSWGFNDGAQIITGGGGASAAPPSPAPPAGGVTSPPPPGNEGTKPIEKPPVEDNCAWKGHCKGASCNTDDDCSDPWACINGKCGTPSAKFRRRMVKRGENGGSL